MNQKLLSLAAVMTGWLASQSAFAVPATCTTLSSGGVEVQECLSGPNYGTYNVTNDSGSDIYAFAVSTQNVGTEPWAQYNGWSAGYYSESDWNTNFGQDAFDHTFGTSDTGAYFFDGRKVNVPILSDGLTVSGSFGFYGHPSSNFVAYNAQGGVIAQSFAAAVPEPETYAMMLVGLTLVGAAARRKRKV